MHITSGRLISENGKTSHWTSFFSLPNLRSDVPGNWKGEKKKENEQALRQLVKESWFLKGSLPGMHVRVAFGCCQWRNPSRAPVNGCCKHSILHHSWARRIFEQRTLSHLFFPLLLLIVWSTKAWERVTCQTKAFWVPWKRRLGGGWKESKWPYYFHLH